MGLRLDRWCVWFLVAVLLLALSAPAETKNPLREKVERIAGTILTGDRSLDYLRELTDRFGGRVGGSPAYEQSAMWAADQFRAMGVSSARLEPFTIPSGWERGPARGRITAPIQRELAIESLGWSPSTPAGGIRAEVVLVDDIAAEKLRAQANQLRGRVALLDTEKIFSGDMVAGLFRLEDSFGDFQQAGALAVLLPDRELSNVLNANSIYWGALLTSIPSAQLGMEDAKLIRRWLQRGPVTIEFAYQNRVSGPVRTHNVIAELRGREKPDEWVIVGAHLDSWDYGTGAQDNGTGVAMVLEAARAIASLGQPPMRSIRFALWGAEEEGLLGSFAYVQQHKAELEKCLAVFNTDTGAGHPFGWRVLGREDLRGPLGEIAGGYLAGLGGEISPELHIGSDHVPFLLHGIPAFDLWVDGAPYRLVHHKPSDTFDKVNRHQLSSGAAIVAITAYVAAEREAPMGARQSRQSVEDLLRKNKIDPAQLFGKLKERGLFE